MLANVNHVGRACVKSTIRRISRRAGYEIVPYSVGFRSFQAQTLAECDALIDVGANVGQFAERAIDSGFRGNIVSFEPSKDAFTVLAGRAHGHQQWVPRQVALGDRVGTDVLHLSANSVSSSLLEVGELHMAAAPESREVRSEPVKVSSLDAEDVPGNSLFLKIDTQGFELQVLRGAESTLKRTSAVQVELSFTELYRGQSSWLEVCSLLEERQFVVHHLESGYEVPGTGRILQADLLFLRS